jgi:hypothetical protein
MYHINSIKKYLSVFPLLGLILVSTIGKSFALVADLYRTPSVQVFTKFNADRHDHFDAGLYEESDDQSVFFLDENEIEDESESDASIASKFFSLGTKESYFHNKFDDLLGFSLQRIVPLYVLFCNWKFHLILN